LRNRFLFNIYTDPDDPLLRKPIRRVVHNAAIRQVFSETEEFVPSPRCRSPFFGAIEFSVRTAKYKATLEGVYQHFGSLVPK
jgi:hypothetical protein